ncbi:hypothetical protein [uncultured Gammaproteobacteria bacterium]|nr:hypothetical protein [uncultured Gammaproteobacteria bacterium]
MHLKQEQPKDNWTGKTEDFYNTNGTLKSASTIKEEFALPSTPKHITTCKKSKF